MLLRTFRITTVLSTILEEPERMEEAVSLPEWATCSVQYWA
ncbi:hypothetical protein [Lewinella cohaerens]|nr:hypothetical protein [Lewinella cohaerens]